MYLYLLKNVASMNFISMSYAFVTSVTRYFFINYLFKVRIYVGQYHGYLLLFTVERILSYKPTKSHL